MMSTSKVGKMVYQRSLWNKCPLWYQYGVRSIAELHYRMGNCLKDVGFVLQPINIPPPGLFQPTDGRCKAPASSVPTKKAELSTPQVNFQPTQPHPFRGNNRFGQMNFHNSIHSPDGLIAYRTKFI